MVIKWFPYEIPIVTTKMPKNEFGEFFFFPSPKIHVSEEVKGTIYSSTILHEVLEMVNEMHDLGLTESKIRTLEVSLSQIFRENPALTKTVFIADRPEGSENDPGDEHGSEGLQDTRSVPRAS